MIDQPNNPGNPNEPESSEFLAELERNTASEIRRQRSQERFEVKAKVVVRPGNTSDQALFAIQGMTGDISEQGCRVLLPRPLQVGDIYRLAFDESVFSLPLVFARCVRCRLVREDAYEIGYIFFSPLEMSSSIKDQAKGGNTESSNLL